MQPTLVLDATSDMKIVKEELFGPGVAVCRARNIDDAIQIHGAIGTSEREPLERRFRDAKVMEIIEGSTQVLQFTIPKHARKAYGFAE